MSSKHFLIPKKAKSQKTTQNAEPYTNIWGIQEYKGDGKSCPIIPSNLPWYKKLFLTFFRFGLCPTCMVMSIGYSIRKLFKKRS